MSQARDDGLFITAFVQTSVARRPDSTVDEHGRALTLPLWGNARSEPPHEAYGRASLIAGTTARRNSPATRSSVTKRKSAFGFVRVDEIESELISETLPPLLLGNYILL